MALRSVIGGYRTIGAQHAIAEFRELFRDGPVATLPDVGHCCHKDAPEIVTALLLRQFM